MEQRVTIDKPGRFGGSYGLINDWVPCYKRKIKQELEEKFFSNYKLKDKLMHPINYLRKKADMNKTFQNRSIEKEFFNKVNELIFKKYNYSVRTVEEHDEIILNGKNKKDIKNNIIMLKKELSDIIGREFYFV
ncbi:hypothetical protein CMO90_00515 [Candidatus Woesearchaeota archaeon]|jgi:hypothetical protein|nr:hypothetical protein [Candidatus Woesearchaeota archaeon]|tara:strand:+ start:319 stop:717 length:399 start_codon:yes stop_codon:yes gene_type:complete